MPILKMTNYFTVCFNKIITETSMAYLVMLGKKEIWIPKSVAYIKNYNSGILKVSRWFIDKYQLKINRENRSELSTSFILKELSLKNIKYPINNAKQYQQAAYDKLFNLKRFALLMECRSGKTKVAIDIACNHSKNGVIDNVIWLCPLSVVETAKSEWQKYQWHSIHVLFYGLESVSGMSSINFNKIAEQVTPKTMLIIDECHMIKNFFTVRSKRLINITEKCAVIGELTGSFITRSLEDIFNQVRMLDWRILGYKTLHQFKANHIEYSDKIPGLISKTYDESILIERLKPFVYEYFNEKYTNIDFKIDSVSLSSSQIYFYQKIKNNFIAKFKSFENNNYDVYILFTALQSVISGFLSCRLAGLAGIKTNKDIILETNKFNRLQYLNDIKGNKIIWCTRRFELEQLVNKLNTPYFVSGDLKSQERHAVIQEFKSKNNAVLIAMVQVARRGIDINNANTSLFISRSFDYEVREQAIARMYGIDREFKTVIDILCENSLDERILTSYERKENIINKFINLLKLNKRQALKEIRKL